MDTIIGIRCKDYVMVAASGTGAHYYIKITDDEDKILPIDSHKMMACVGENGARVNFSEYVRCNMRLNTIRQHGRKCTTDTVAHFMRNELAKSIRSRDGAYAVNALVAGYDLPLSEHDDMPPSTNLFYLDYLGTMQPVPYGAHGYGASFCVGLLDRKWRPDMTPQEGADLLQQCCDEVKRRIVFSNAHFVCRVVDKNGIQDLPNVR